MSVRGVWSISAALRLWSMSLVMPMGAVHIGWMAWGTEAVQTVPGITLAVTV